METYTTFGGELPEPDPSILTARTEWQQRPLDGLSAIIGTDGVTRTEDQEDDLAGVYKPLVQFATNLVGAQAGLLDPIVQSIQTNVQTAIGTQTGMLAAVPGISGDVIDPNRPVCCWKATDAATGVDRWFTKDPLSGGWVEVPGDCSSATCTTDPFPDPLPPPSPPIPVPLSPPVPPAPAPVPDSCKLLDGGTITLPAAPCIYLYVQCQSDTSAVFQVVDCCNSFPARDGWIAVGPLASAPDEQVKTRAAQHCIMLRKAGCLSTVQTLSDVLAGVNPCVKPPVPPPVPPSPPVPPGTITPASPPSAPSPDGSEGISLWNPAAVPGLPATGSVSCEELDWASPTVCVCMDRLILIFADFGRWARENTSWIATDASSLNDWEVGKRKASIGLSGLKLIFGKFSYSDPTLIAMAEQLIRISERNFQTDIDAALNKGYDAVNNLAKYVSGDKADTLFALYMLRGFVGYVQTYSNGFLAHLYDGPDISINYTKVLEVLDYAIDYVQPIKLPSVADVESMYQGNVITEQHAKCLVNLNGHQYPITRALWDSRRQQPTSDTIVRNYLRTLPGRDNLEKELRKQGWTDPHDVDQLLAGYEYLPPPSDAIRWAIKDVFDPTKLGRAEMLEELKLNVGLQELFVANGMDDTTLRTKDGRLLPVKTLENYWLMSYEEVSPTQVFEMFHRFRPNRVKRYPLPGPNNTTVYPEVTDITTVRKLLKEVDYNPIWRDRLAGIAYRVLGRIDVRNAYSLGAFGKPIGKAGFDLTKPGEPRAIGQAEKELVEQSLDQGTSPADAQVQAFIGAAGWERANKARTSLRQQRIICASYTAGVFSEKEALAKMTAVVEDETRAAELVRLCDAEAKLRAVKEGISAVRSLFLSAQISDLQAQAMLRQQGVQAFRIGELLHLWEIRLNGRDKSVAAATLCNWYTTGLIDRTEFKARLIRMGHQDTDANRIVRSCELGYAAKTRKDLDRQAKIQAAQVEKKRAADVRAGKELDAEQARRFQRFLNTRSEKHLIGYYQEGVISVEEVRQTLAAKEYTAADIERWVYTYLKPKKGATNGTTTNGSA